MEIVNYRIFTDEPKPRLLASRDWDPWQRPQVGSLINIGFPTNLTVYVVTRTKANTVEEDNPHEMNLATQAGALLVTQDGKRPAAGTGLVTQLQDGKRPVTQAALLPRRGFHPF